MKKLILLILIVVTIESYSQGWQKLNFREDVQYTTYTADADTNWDFENTAKRWYEYTIKWTSLDDTDSYMSIYLAGDPDGDDVLDWVRDSTKDSLQLTPASGVAKIVQWDYGILSDGLRLHYFVGSVTSGDIDIEVNLIIQK